MAAELINIANPLAATSALKAHRFSFIEASLDGSEHHQITIAKMLP
jgi:hypothetical protein